MKINPKRSKSHWSVIGVDSAHDSTKQLFRDGVAIVQHLEDTCNEEWQHQSTRVKN